MRSRLTALVFAALSLLGTAHADVSPDPKKAPSGSYALEPRHTQVIWSLSHYGITDFYGRFGKASGSLNFNATAPEKSSVNVTIDISSINTQVDALTTELAGPGMFDTAQFPTATFKSTSVERTGPGTGKITGNLTLHGVTKPVTFDATFGGGTHDPFSGNYDIGFHATATVKRSDFGIKGVMLDPFVSDDVKLTIEALFIQQKA